MAIGIIWSLAVKGRLIFFKYLYFGNNKKKDVNQVPSP